MNNIKSQNPGQKETSGHPWDNFPKSFLICLGVLLFTTPGLSWLKENIPDYWRIPNSYPENNYYSIIITLYKAPLKNRREAIFTICAGNFNWNLENIDGFFSLLEKISKAYKDGFIK